MATITVDRFELGVDHRKIRDVADANRLRRADNVYITTGWSVRKRPGLARVDTLEPGTAGLVSGSGVMNTFHGSGSVSHANPLFVSHLIQNPGGSAVRRVHFGRVFLGALYVAAEYVDGTIYHSYLDGTSPPRVTDANCPQGPIVAMLGSKVFSPAGEVVRFSATDDPRDWTTASDAGFLAAGRFAGGRSEVSALGQYQGDLVVLFPDSAQVWDVDPDPSLIVFDQAVEGVGTTQPGTVANLAGDVFFRAGAGYRSLSLLALTSNLAEVDVGSAIDRIVRARVADAAIEPQAVYHPGGGQYVCLHGARSADVYTFSRTAKVSAWTQYVFGPAVDTLASHENSLYVRAGDDVFRLDESVYTDDGQPFEVVVETALLDLKKPGELKQITGFDLVQSGASEVSFRFLYVTEDGELAEGETQPVAISGNTRPGAQIPVELAVTEIAPIFRVANAEPWELGAFAFHFDPLGPIY